ncbi:MAG: NAD(P)-dependent oxidoreductase [Chthonomonas sp.]
MRVCVVGGSGMLGCEVVREATSRGWEVWAPSRGEFDVTDPVSVAQIAVAEPKFDACINCAAYTAVDRAETERDEALAMNALGPAYLAAACLQAGSRLVHVSTDFVFDGTASEPYRTGDPTHPLSVYGESKLEGEGPVLGSGGIVVRTSWLFGPERGGGFPGAIVRAARAGKPLRVVADQVGTPTYAPDLARLLVEMVAQNAAPGLYHAAGPEVLTWHAFAVRAVRACGLDVEVQPIATSDWPTAAHRPAYSALDSSSVSAFGWPFRDLDGALAAWFGRASR